MQMITCLGAGPDGICTIFEVTSCTLLSTGKFNGNFPLSGQRWSLTPEQGARFVTSMKWFLPSDPYRWKTWICFIWKVQILVMKFAMSMSRASAPHSDMSYNIKVKSNLAKPTKIEDLSKKIHLHLLEYLSWTLMNFRKFHVSAHHIIVVKILKK